MNENQCNQQSTQQAQCDVPREQVGADAYNAKAGYVSHPVMAPPTTVRAAIKARIEQHLRRAAELQQLMDTTDWRILDHSVSNFHRVYDGFASLPF